MGSRAGCEADSQFYEELASFEPTCMNTTSEVTSAVSVVHQLSEDNFDSSSNSSGDGDVDPPLPREML